MAKNTPTHPSAAEWERYKMERMKESFRVSDYEYLMELAWCRDYDQEQNLELLREIWIRLLETEPYWEPQPIGSWNALGNLYALPQLLQEQDWVGAVTQLDNVLKYGTAQPRLGALNSGLMAQIKQILKEDFADVRLAGEVLPLYRGKCRTPEQLGGVSGNN